MNTGRVIFFDNNPDVVKDCVNKYDPDTISITVVDKEENIIQEPIPVRLQVGEYMTSVREEGLTSGEKYEIRWLYGYNTLSINQMKRFEFTYNQNYPVIAGMCAVYGNETKAGLGIVNTEIKATTRLGDYTRHYNSEYTNTYTDIFGNWHIYMPVSSTVIVTVNEVNKRKYISVPTDTSIDLDDITALQSSLSTDAFGNFN